MLMANKNFTCVKLMLDASIWKLKTFEISGDWCLKQSYYDQGYQPKIYYVLSHKDYRYCQRKQYWWIAITEDLYDFKGCI